MQIHGVGDKVRAYICEGQFLDLDPMTFGATGTAYIPGFKRFYRHVLLGRFHHHAAVAFTHCGATLYDALKQLGVDEIYTPLPEHMPYPGENIFATGRDALFDACDCDCDCGDDCDCGCENGDDAGEKGKGGGCGCNC